MLPGAQNAFQSLLQGVLQWACVHASPQPPNREPTTSGSPARRSALGGRVSRLEASFALFYKELHGEGVVDVPLRTLRHVQRHQEKGNKILIHILGKIIKGAL